MSEIVYDIPISEVANILEKSDRQVRRYVKEKRIKARPVRVDGHVKLMFSRMEVLAFKERFAQDYAFGESGREIIVDAQLIGGDGDVIEDSADTAVIDSMDTTGDASAVKYVIDALRDQISSLQDENRELHYQLEQRSGQVGFLQGKIETLQEEIKMLAPIPKPEDARKPWYRRLFGHS